MSAGRYHREMQQMPASARIVSHLSEMSRHAATRHQHHLQLTVGKYLCNGINLMSIDELDADKFVGDVQVR